MSTILDALKKVERDREGPHEEVLAEIALPPPQTPRRGIPTRVIIACASIGFAAGIGLALWRDSAPPQQAPPLEPATAPVIDVPPPPVAKAPPGVQPPAASAVNAGEAALAPPPPAAVAKAEPPANPAPVAAVPPTAAQPQPDAAPPPSVPAVANPPLPPPNAPVAANPPAPLPNAAAPNAPGAPPVPNVASAPANPAAPANAPVVVGSADHGAVVEPSPFTAGNEPGVAASAAPTKPGRGGRKSQAGPPAAAAPPPPQVALAPPPPVIAPPSAAVAPPPPAPESPPAPPQAEPAQPPATVIDTGRSPPGSPRVALTFLQWSADPSRRFAFVSIDGAPAVRIREGDTPSGLTVAEITRTGVQFKREGQVFMIRPRH